MPRYSDDDESAEYHNNRRFPKRIRTVGVVQSPRSSGSDSTDSRSSEVSEYSSERSREESPRYYGRTSYSREESPRYNRRTSYSREESPRHNRRTSYSREESDREQVVEEEDKQSQGHRNSTSRGIGSGRDPDGSVPFTLADPDVLDCPICLDPLGPPIFQCDNGHIACSPCCITMKNKCGSCSLPIGYNRCRAMEKVLESVKVPCKNKLYGCDKTLSYSEKLEHEKTCNFAPCSCPYPDCDYINSSECLYKHFERNHTSSRLFHFNGCISVKLVDDQKYFFLQDVDDYTLFILNRCIEPLGNFMSVICVAPTSSKKKFWYDLIARYGSTFVKLRTYAECMPEWTESKSSKTSLLVPNGFVEDGQLELELYIREEGFEPARDD